MTNPNSKLDSNIFTSKIKEIAIRDGYGDGVVEAGVLNENVVVLCSDLTDSTRSHLFKQRFPNRFIETGVAEQNMAGIAAGMALSGKVPFISSYAEFNPGRNWEQIRVSICYSEANVKIVGTHAGLSVGADGATHQNLEDIALTRVLPNLTVIVPADYKEAKKATINAAELDGPVYIRLEKEKTPAFTTQETPFKIGKAQILMTGSSVTVIGCGPIIYEALKACAEIKIKHGIDCDVINCHTIKPLDEKTILESVKKTRRVVTVENHQRSGGLGGAICELLSEKLPVKVKRIGVDDMFGESGQYSQLVEKYGLGQESIKVEILDLLKNGS